MGVIRGISVRTSYALFLPLFPLMGIIDPLVASNWAMGTFVVVSLGTW